MFVIETIFENHHPHRYNYACIWFIFRYPSRDFHPFLLRAFPLPESTNRTGQRPLASEKEPMMTQRWPFKSVRETRLRAIATDLVWNERTVEGVFDAGMYHESGFGASVPGALSFSFLRSARRLEMREATSGEFNEDNNEPNEFDSDDAESSVRLASEIF
jgi:hypothetical protein